MGLDLLEGKLYPQAEKTDLLVTKVTELKEGQAELRAELKEDHAELKADFEKG